MSEKFTPGPWRVDATVALGAYGVYTDYCCRPGLREVNGGGELGCCFL